MEGWIMEKSDLPKVGFGDMELRTENGSSSLHESNFVREKLRSEGTQTVNMNTPESEYIESDVALMLNPVAHCSSLSFRALHSAPFVYLSPRCG